MSARCLHVGLVVVIAPLRPRLELGRTVVAVQTSELARTRAIHADERDVLARLGYSRKRSDDEPWLSDRRGVVGDPDSRIGQSGSVGPKANGVGDRTVLVIVDLASGSVVLDDCQEIAR